MLGEIPAQALATVHPHSHCENRYVWNAVIAIDRARLECDFQCACVVVAHVTERRDSTAIYVGHAQGGGCCCFCDFFHTYIIQHNTIKHNIIGKVFKISFFAFEVAFISIVCYNGITQHIRNK